MNTPKKLYRSCPFCDEPGELIRDKREVTKDLVLTRYHVKCSSSDCYADGPWAVTEQYAIAMWEQRLGTK